MSIQPLWLTHFIEILLVLKFQLTKTYFGTFSYKAHFRPQISSNDPWWSLEMGSILKNTMHDLQPRLIVVYYCTFFEFHS